MIVYDKFGGDANGQSALGVGGLDVYHAVRKLQEVYVVRVMGIRESGVYAGKIICTTCRRCQVRTVSFGVPENVSRRIHHTLG